MNFKDTYIDAPLYEEDSIIKHYYDAEMPSRYNSNFMLFKHMPTLAQFQYYEQKQLDFHQTHQMKHRRFLFPENQQLPTALLAYIEAQHYVVGSLELYAMLPIEFNGSSFNEEVVVQYVDDALFPSFLAFQYTIDLTYGEIFATEKQHLLKKQFNDSSIQFVVALLDGQIVGSLLLFLTADTVELDSFVIIDSLQRRGIGSTMQQFVMNQHTEQTILLVADGEDTPRKMYAKQGYHYCSAWHEIVFVPKE
ncbi:MAG TPA: GNAT family N-acetyltransferase [Candidatus Kurthia intestinigallinarum]|nr:GNAT family N-acetyltransferase [Candidatus Kurthia intestinigallinarum]